MKKSCEGCRASVCEFPATNKPPYCRLGHKCAMVPSDPYSVYRLKQIPLEECEKPRTYCQFEEAIEGKKRK